MSEVGELDGDRRLQAPPVTMATFPEYSGMVAVDRERSAGEGSLKQWNLRAIPHIRKSKFLSKFLSLLLVLSCENVSQLPGIPRYSKKPCDEKSGASEHQGAAHRPLAQRLICELRRCRSPSLLVDIPCFSVVGYGVDDAATWEWISSLGSEVGRESSRSRSVLRRFLTRSFQNSFC